MPPQVAKQNRQARIAYSRLTRWLNQIVAEQTILPFPPGTAIDSLWVDKPSHRIRVALTDQFSYVPLREVSVAAIYQQARAALGWRFRNYRLTLYSLQTPIQTLIPNIFRSESGHYDYRRMPEPEQRRPRALVRNVSTAFTPANGLAGRNIVVWPSHGWYYNLQEDVWEWQRPRLFQTVEDLLPYAFVIPYLEPMLENAGAHVFIPRERDIQTHEVVLDNDDATTSGTNPNFKIWSASGSAGWLDGDSTGLAYGSPPYPANFNPFGTGSQLVTTTDSVVSAILQWIPNIPQRGEYAVYITYWATDSNSNEAHYRVNHLGGSTDFRVNQQMGGNTWLYLGKFEFDSGYHPQHGSVGLLNDSGQPGSWISGDAVRFGGGMGLIMRNGRTSGRPKFTEGSRYYLQYIGMPDTLVYSLNDNKNDYQDDYQSRSEYANYLSGAPDGPNTDRAVKGLGIPIDLSLAFHTDAGIAGLDTTIGTLAIYSITDMDSARIFPDGVSRLANRDLADIMQSEIVHDIQAKYDSTWHRRNLIDAMYSEAARPNMPGMLLELLSHQNFTDMKYALDPAFRFDVARAIYKSMLKFIAFQYQQAYVVEPLPIKAFQAILTDTGSVVLRWQPEIDPLEPTARPGRYRIYTRINDSGFDNGQLVDGTQFVLADPDTGKLYGFRVAGVNRGGTGFPSATLAVGIAARPDNPPALVIDGFDRVSAPATLAFPHMTGFADFMDEGVPDKVDINFTGDQFQFEPATAFLTNAFPGFGASYANAEVRPVAGNTRDYVTVHGKALLANGISFSSSTRQGLRMSGPALNQYYLVDVILGEQRTEGAYHGLLPESRKIRFSVFSPELRDSLTSLLKTGGKLFLSGAYIATDPLTNPGVDDSTKSLIRGNLKMKWVTDHAARNGKIVAADSLFYTILPTFEFNQGKNQLNYAVESPDALAGGQGAVTICRYAENRFSAGYAFRGDYRLVVLGFPFESIEKSGQNRVFEAILRYLQ